MNDRKPPLGRGLGALIPPTPPATSRATSQCPIEAIRPSPLQPRKVFDDEKLDELAASIREIGVIQPLIVRPSGDGYELIAGERRWRAAQRAGLREVPVIVKELADPETVAIALIENIQREN
ncbi:MAG: ParB/RepB/Spo0J family partition protein, partial [Myxococcales bacterium]|nr:ParB/RepB/Spo0J family partition protein [Myxococcales bacterium]